MFSLTAGVVTEVLKADERPKVIKIWSDSTTIARIAKEKSALDIAGGGMILSAYESLVFLVRPGCSIFAVSAGTPNISIAEVMPTAYTEGIIW